MRRIVVPTLFLLLAVASGPSARADDPPANPLAAPAAAPAPPDFVRPGTRGTWWCGGVSIEETREQIYVEDPRGKFYDNEGHRYRILRKVEDTGGSLPNNSGGAGYTQIDVAGVEGDVAILNYRYLVLDDVNVPPVLFFLSGGKVSRADGNGLWSAPAALKKVEPAEGLKIFQGPYRVGDRTFPSIVFAGDTMARVFDLDSGVLLVERTQGQSQRGWVKRNHVYYPAPPRTSGSLMLFRSMRRTALPWADGKMPDWVAKTKVLHYRSGQTIEMPGSGVMTVPSTSTVRLTEVGKTYSLYEAEWYQPAYGPQPEQRATVPYAVGPASLGGFWVDPAKIADLEAGRTLDEDPIAGGTLSVTNRGTSVDGHDFVTIAEQAERYVAEWTYDRKTGILLYSRLIHPSPLQRTITWMKLARTE